MKLIGGTFADELRAAGINAEGVTWGPDGKIEYRADVPQATRDAVAAVLAAHNPASDESPEYIDAQKTTASQELLNPKLAHAAALEAVFAFVKNPALHSTAASLKQDAVQRYRAKL